MLTIKQAAERLGLNVVTVRGMIRSKQLPCYRIGPKHGRIMVSEDDCERYLRSCRVEKQEQPAPTERVPVTKYQYQVISPSPRHPRARRHAH